MEKVTIITVCFNAEEVIEKTIKSVLSQTYLNKEYIVVDGASTDHTVIIIDQYRDKIDKIISEKDYGIYDAMNKGIRNASGEWLIFLNAGDVFASKSVLEEIFTNGISTNISFLYSDAYMQYGSTKLICTMNFDKGALNHQCCIYRKKLHEIIGFYLVTKKLIISDYIFFIQVPNDCVRKIDTIISVYEGGGVSSKFPSRRFALCADVVFRRRSFFNMIKTALMQNLGDFLPLKFKYKLKKIIYNE